MVSKGRIYGELRKFFSYLQNSIKLDNEYGWEIREINIFLERILQDKSIE